MADREIDIGEIEERGRDRLVALLRSTKKCKCRGTEECNCGKPNKMKPELYTAAKEADIDAFIGALEDYSGRGISLDDIFYELSPGWNSLLHVAATNVKEDIVKAIIDFFPDHCVSNKNSQGDTVLHIAARAGAIETVKLILQHGGSLQTKNSSGNTPLHEALTPLYRAERNTTPKPEAVRNRHHQVIEYLVNAANAEILCAQNGEGRSPLYLAVETGDLKVLELLLRVPIEGKALPEIEGLLPVHCAVIHQQMDMMKAMWEEQQGRWRGLFELKDGRGSTPLHLASYSNSLEGVKFLIGKLPSSAFQYDEDENFPIHVACEMGHVEVIKALLEQWPNPMEFRTKQGQNILHVSAKHGSTAAVKYILGDSNLVQLINEKDGSGNSALHLAAKNWEPAALLALARDERVNHELVNKDNLTAFDIVMRNMKGVDEPLHKRLTRIIMASAGRPERSKDLAIRRPKGQNSPEESEPPELDKLKAGANAQMVLKADANTLRDAATAPQLDNLKGGAETRMIVATLVAAVTFAAGFTVPGGFSGSDPDTGMCILLNKAMFQVFVICNTLAMYSSVIALVILLWAQMNDPHVVQNTLLIVRAPLLLSLATMSGAFLAGVYLTTSKLAWLSILVLTMGIVALIIILAFYLFQYIPLGCTNNRLVRPLLDFIIVKGISMSRSSISHGKRGIREEDGNMYFTFTPSPGKLEVCGIGEQSQSCYVGPRGNSSGATGPGTNRPRYGKRSINIKKKINVKSPIQTRLKPATTFKKQKKEKSNLKKN